MFPLDPKTVQRLAEIIVDDGGYNRRGWQLSALLKHSGWSDPPEFDGWSRVAWLVEQMLARQDDRVAIERLLCRVCDPLEYDSGMVEADAFRLEINDKLASERLVITYAAGRPVLDELRADGSGPQHSEPPELERRIRSLVTDNGTVDVLTRRLDETRICEHGGAFTMAIIGIGSLVEGLLLALVLQHGERDQLRGKDGKLVSLDFVSLSLLINVAHTLGWIQLDAKMFLHNVRDFRNFVHPRKMLADQPDFDAESVQMCWTPVQAVLNDLESALSAGSA
jgi:hypothetical protein